MTADEAQLIIKELDCDGDKRINFDGMKIKAILSSDIGMGMVGLDLVSDVLNSNIWSTSG